MSMWEARGHKADREEQAYRNEQFLWGKQWYWWENDQWVPRRDVEGWRARLVYNDILTTVEQRGAKMQRSKPTWNYMSATDETHDKIIQRRNQQVMDWTYSEGIKMPAKLRDATQWAMSSAIVFFRPFWNRKKGPKLGVTLDQIREQASMIPDPVARQDAIREADNRFWQTFGQDAYQRGKVEFPSGEPDVAVHPIYEVNWWPFKPKARDNVRVWCISVKKTVAEVAEEFGKDQDEIRQMAMPQSGRVSGVGDQTSKWGDKYFWDSEDAAAPYDDDCLLVHTLYHVPNEQFPMGCMAVVVGQGGSVIHGPVDIPNPLGTPPIIPLVEKPIRGNFLGTCVVDQMISPQEDLNAKASMVADYCNRKIAPTIVDFYGNEGSNKQALSNKPGIIYKASGPDKVPQVIKMPDIGIDYFRMMDTDRLWMQNIGGVSSIDDGRTDDANVRSGRAILALKAQNDLRLIPFGEALDEAVAEVGDYVIAMWWAYANNERLIQLVGEGNELEVLAFKGTELRPSGFGKPGFNNAVIKSTAFSNIPRSPEEVMNFLTVMGNNGLIMPEDRNAIVEMLGYADFRKLLDKRRPDETRQWYEIEQWKKGKIVGPPDESDLDDVHLEAIDKWRKTEEYKQLFQMSAFDPQAAALIADITGHYDTHKKWQARKLVEQQYNLLDADLTMWMKHRGEWMRQFAENMAKTGMPPDPQVAAVVMGLYQLPMGAGGGGMANPGMAGQKPGGDQKEQGNKPAAQVGKSSAGRMPNGTSPQQGVPRNENVSREQSAVA